VSSLPTVFCTYCSRQKDPAPHPIPALERYQSERIRKVHRAAGALGLKFYILSGEFGLLAPEHLIPWYNHLLQPEEVAGLAVRVAAQIAAEEIGGIVHFTHRLQAEPQVIPYHDTLLAACRFIARPFMAVEFDIA
jgi:hypothetical protein